MSKRKRHLGPRKPVREQPPASVHPGWIPSGVGLAVSAYLLALDLFSTRAFCLTRYDCELVRSSAFARILGIPVAALGVFFFAAALGLCVTRAAGRDRWLVPLAGLGAGGAVVFVGLQFFLIRAVCPYCLLAETAAFVLAYLVLRNGKPAAWIQAGSIGTLVVIVLSTIYALTPTPPVESDYTTRLARYLTQSGAVMYGAYWCPHCREQKAMFGAAASLLPYVECDPQGHNPQPNRCRARGVRAFPTWEFHGRTVEGVFTLDQLAQLSGFKSQPPGG